MNRPHRRFNPLTGDWVLVSPHRAKRPWQGQVERASLPASLPYDPGCYLCPGNSRAGGQRNPAYTGTFVFENDFAALLPAADDSAPRLDDAHPLLIAQPEHGICEVICFSPDHSLTLARMTQSAVEEVVDVWTAETRRLSALPFIGAVQIFENRGEMMGSSNPHPHGQIWATESVPTELAREVKCQQQRPDLLLDYRAEERRRKERLVMENASFTVVVPFWAVWPFETLILPARHVASLDELNAVEQRDLAEILRRLTACYDRVFDAPFPYTMGIHQRPVHQEGGEAFQMHLHFYPPLLRSATVKKFMVGFEMLGMPQRDITAEAAAERLRAVAD